jgi:hypothetical protein
MLYYYDLSHEGNNSNVMSITMMQYNMYFFPSHSRLRQFSHFRTKSNTNTNKKSILLVCVIPDFSNNENRKTNKNRNSNTNTFLISVIFSGGIIRVIVHGAGVCINCRNSPEFGWFHRILCYR